MKNNKLRGWIVEGGVLRLETPAKNLACYYSSCVYTCNTNGDSILLQFFECDGEKVQQFLLDLING